MDIPRFDAEYTGSGDLFAALLLARMYRHPGDLKVCHQLPCLVNIDREFKFCEFFHFLKFNEFYQFFSQLKKLVILQIIDV